MNKLYDHDGYGWAMEQAALLRTGKLSALDIDNLAEEIDSMGKTIKNELVSRLVVLLQHLLKWEFQPTLRSGSWRASILEQRDRIAGLVGDNPSLKPKIPDAMHSAYRVARIRAVGETTLPEKTFPAECPYDFKTATDENFWPGNTQASS